MSAFGAAAPVASGAASGAVDAVTGAISKADAEDEATRAEKSAVAALWREYQEARDFDKGARSRYVVDRRYAAGTADSTWLVDTNLIGSFIDILVAFLYARDPDVSVKKSPQVDAANTKDMESFAETLQIVISSLWKSVQTRLKQNARKQVRSALSVGPGWIKANIVCDGTNIPQMQSKLGDLRDNIADLEATRNALMTQEPPQSIEEQEAELAKLRDLETSLARQIEVALRKKLVVDFVSAADMQVALNVPSISDYVDADWVANAIYRKKDDVKAMFPRLTDKDIGAAKVYYLKPLKEETPLQENSIFDSMYGASLLGIDDEADQYTAGGASGAGTLGVPTGETGPCFYRVVELWNKRTNHVHTMIEGVQRWAKEPYQPDYPTTRFYPYFELEFYQVDGARHPQSLSWRLRKLQDEYSRSRSNFRVTRERSIPGIVFNSSLVEPDEAKKLERSVHQELTGLRLPTDQPLDRMFGPKPVASIDMRLFDNSTILSDMEKIAGVQEALQSSVSTPKTAREAEIQNSGFASRTSADRDQLEVMLTDLAQYTAEQSLTALSAQDVQRIAGAAAFWPEGMDINDLLTLVEVQIEAGTTGKPKEAGDREAWGVILPVLKETILQLQEAILTGNEPLAKALTATIRETLKRMGDDIDYTQFLPLGPAPMVPPAPAGAPGDGGPPDPGAMPPPEALPPGAQPMTQLPPLIDPVPTG